MSLRAPMNRYEAAWQQWNYGGGAQRGEPMPRPEDYPDAGSIPLGRVGEALPPVTSDWPSPYELPVVRPSAGSVMPMRGRRRTLRSFGSY